MAVGEIEWTKFPILVVDDESDNLDAFRFTFGKTFTLHLASGAEEALNLVRAHDMAVVVTDQRMPRMTGLELLRAVRDIRPDAVGIIVTAFTDVDVLIESISLGRIYRYITKPWDSKELRGILVHAVERFHLVRENRRLLDQLSQYVRVLSREADSAFNFGAIVGDSPALRQVLAKVEQVAQTTATVLLRGETGTGKEMVARAIHINSPRESRPFVRVNCAALAPGFWNPSCSVTRRALSPARWRAGRGASSWPTAARYFSTRWATFPSTCRSSCCGSCRSVSSNAWAGWTRSRWTCVSSRPPTAIWNG